jgi:hypothetical protein
VNWVTEFQEIFQRPLIAQEKLAFERVLGLYSINAHKYLIVVTSVATFMSFWDINYVSGFQIVQISPGRRDSGAEWILRQGLNLSRLYYSPNHDLSLTLLQQASGSPARNIFV